MIRVGKCIYDKGVTTYPSYEEFTPIIVMLKSSSKYWPLSPYYLKDDNGRIMENIWQFSKVYEKVPKSTQYVSRWDRTITWKYPAETHVINGELTEGYKNWRNKGMNAPLPIRYPVGFNHRHECLYAIKEGTTDKLGYIDSRKKDIYEIIL